MKDQIQHTRPENQLDLNLTEKAPHLSRRSALGLVLGSTALISLLGCVPKTEPTRPTNYYPDTHTLVKVDARPTRMSLLESSFDAQYLISILDQLARNKPELSPGQKAKNIADNLVYLDADAGATGLMIDESGYFMHAGHTFGAFPAGDFRPMTEMAVVYVPKTGLLTPIRNYVIDQDRDISLFYAPTGLPRKPIGAQIAAGLPLQGEELWLYSLLMQKDTKNPKADIKIAKGTTTIFSDPIHGDGYLESFYVAGMIPQGGDSGGIVGDKSGNIRGILSGSYPNIRGRENALGARVSGIVGLEALNEQLRNGQIRSLPIR